MRLRAINIFSAFLGDLEKTKERTVLILTANYKIEPKLHKDITTTLNMYADATKKLKKSEFANLDAWFQAS